MGIGSKMNALAAYQTAEPSAPRRPSSSASHARGDRPSNSPDEQAIVRRSVRTKLAAAVGQRQLHKLYPSERLDQVADRVMATVNFREVAQQWKLPMELALDLSSLALYDILIYADDSYSMEGSNWNDDLMAIVRRTASVATLFDDDGISVRFMNGNKDRDNVRTEQEVMTLLREARPCGLTPIGTALRAKILNPYLTSIGHHLSSPWTIKPLLVITVTDGAPQGEPEDTLFKAIRECRQRLQSMGLSGNEVAFQFAQVGDDERATAFLDELDNHPEVGQFVDATSNFEREAEQWHRSSKGLCRLTPDVYLLKLLCGAIDFDWDSRDDNPNAARPSCPPASHRHQQKSSQPQTCTCQ